MTFSNSELFSAATVVINGVKWEERIGRESIREEAEKRGVQIGDWTLKGDLRDIWQLQERLAQLWENALEAAPRTSEGEPEDKFSCSRCSFTTLRSSHLVRHEQKHSEGEVVSHCSECPFKCLRKGDLARHRLKVHSEQSALYSCSMDGCGFQTLRKELRDKHVNYGHNIVAGKEDNGKHECLECGYVTHSEAYFNRHRLVHEKSRIKTVHYSCIECQYKTLKAANLKRHSMSVHAGSRPHVCRTCDVGFKRPDTLRQHVMAAHEFKKRGRVITKQEKKDLT